MVERSHCSFTMIVTNKVSDDAFRALVAAAEVYQINQIIDALDGIITGVYARQDIVLASAGGIAAREQILCGTAELHDSIELSNKLVFTRTPRKFTKEGDSVELLAHNRAFVHRRHCRCC